MGKKNYFVEGNIRPEFIAEQIALHQRKTDIGAHAIFLGQVRADEIENKKVSALIYSCYREMAEKTLDNLRENLFSKYDIRCLHIYHSSGEVKVGEVSLFVFLSAAHRQQTFDALHELVDRIKAEVPIWKKEVFADGSTFWV